MSNPDDVFNLLKKMREAKGGQRIVTQPRLTLGNEAADKDEERRTPTYEGRDPEGSNEDRGESDESRTKPDSRDRP